MVALSLLPAIFFATSRHPVGSNRIASSTTTTLFATQTLEICMSPGCIADGSDDTLLQMQALSPPGTVVKPGVCCSLCGNGPVVLEESNNKKYRKVTQDKLLTILFGDDGVNSDVEDIVSGLNLVSDAQGQLAKGNNEDAIALFEKGIETGWAAAKSLDKQRQKEQTSDVQGKYTANSGLQWVLQARLGETQARLGAGDTDGAIRSAEAGLELFDDTPPLELLELLHESYQTKGDDKGELTALRAYFDAPEPEKQTSIQANKRRQLGFRLAKLERELG